jgi:hypothetical protein
MSKDNRKSKRVKAKHFISYDLINPKGEIVENGMALSLDLSREGVLLETRTGLSKNDTVTIHIAVGEDVVHLTGKVKHTEKIEEAKFQMGIHFEDMTDEKAQKIASFYPDIFR